MRLRPAHQSMINRRFNDRASCPARKSPKPALARKPPIHLPASGKGGHESVLDLIQSVEMSTQRTILLRYCQHRSLSLPPGPFRVWTTMVGPAGFEPATTPL